MSVPKVIVVSAVNIVEGGTLTILNQCLACLDSTQAMYREFRIIALVHRKGMFHFKNIELVEYPIAKKKWLYRVYYEYIGFYFLSKRLKPWLWLSLHDISPNVRARFRAVYCHNPTPFYHMKRADVKYSYKIFLFSLFYKYLYRINIKRNDYVIVQQQWLRDAFQKMFSLDSQRIIVACPHEVPSKGIVRTSRDSYRETTTLFFFPSLSRPFKNFEIVCKATELLCAKGFTDFQVVLTIDGTENLYSKEIVNAYRHNRNISFCGRLPYNEVFDLYEKTSCLIFPSKLETWGLPVSEFIQYDKPMILADLPYAHETAAGANHVAFFDPNNERQLCNLMEDIIQNKKEKFIQVSPIQLNTPYADSWSDLFNILLRKK